MSFYQSLIRPFLCKYSPSIDLTLLLLHSITTLIGHYLVVIPVEMVWQVGQWGMGWVRAVSSFGPQRDGEQNEDDLHGEDGRIVGARHEHRDPMIVVDRDVQTSRPEQRQQQLPQERLFRPLASAPAFVPVPTLQRRPPHQPPTPPRKRLLSQRQQPQPGLQYRLHTDPKSTSALPLTTAFPRPITAPLGPSSSHLPDAAPIGRSPRKHLASGNTFGNINAPRPPLHAIRPRAVSKIHVLPQDPTARPQADETRLSTQRQTRQSQGHLPVKTRPASRPVPSLRQPNITRSVSEHTVSLEKPPNGSIVCKPGKPSTSMSVPAASRSRKDPTTLAGSIDGHSSQPRGSMKRSVSGGVRSTATTANKSSARVTSGVWETNAPSLGTKGRPVGVGTRRSDREAGRTEETTLSKEGVKVGTGRLREERGGRVGEKRMRVRGEVVGDGVVGGDDVREVKRRRVLVL